MNRLKLVIGLLCLIGLTNSWSIGVSFDRGYVSAPPDSLDLFRAIDLDDVKAIQHAINNGASINNANQDGLTPLHYAVKAGKLAVVECLLQNKANCHSTDNTNKIPLFYAVENQNRQMVEVLLEAKTNPDKCDCITVIVSVENEAILELFADHKADLNSGLITAAKNNNLNFTKKLISLGAKVKSDEVIEYAIANGNVEILNIALKNGGDADNGLIKAVEKEDKTAILACLNAGAKSNPVGNYVIRFNDEALAIELIEKFKFDSDVLLEKALPGSKKVPMVRDSAQLNMVKIAVERKANGDDYLSYGVITDFKPLIELLIANGADPNKLLRSAVEQNHLDFAKYAFENGADPKKNNTHFLRAIEANNEAMANLFLDNEAPVTDARLIRTAVEKGNLQLAERLLENGAPAKDRGLMLSAVTTKHIELVTLLLKYGADPNIGFVEAIDQNDSEMVELLLQGGAEGRTPHLIAKAAANGNLAIAKSLMKRGAQPDDGVIASIIQDHYPMFILLMESGADYSNIQFVIATVLHDRTAMFKALMSKDAPVNYKNDKQENLLHEACKNDNYEIARLLIDRGVNVNQKDVDGTTPLHIVVNSGRNNLEMCSLLVNNGANVNAVDNKGRSILKLADGKKLKDYLKTKGALK